MAEYYRIKDTAASPAAWRIWKNGDYLPLTRAERRNSAILVRLFTDTQTGKIKGFYLDSEKTFFCFSPQPEEPRRRSIIRWALSRRGIDTGL